MCCCCCKKQTWACCESGGCRTPTSLCLQLCPAGWPCRSCHWGCYCSFLKCSWQCLATLVALVLLVLRISGGGQPAAVAFLRQRHLSALMHRASGDPTEGLETLAQVHKCHWEGKAARERKYSRWPNWLSVSLPLVDLS